MHATRACADLHTDNSSVCRARVDADADLKFHFIRQKPGRNTAKKKHCHFIRQQPGGNIAHVREKKRPEEHSSVRTTDESKSSCLVCLVLIAIIQSYTR